MSKTSKLGPDESLARHITHNPAAADIAEQLGIDFCCGGQASLREACQERHLDPEMILRQFADAERTSDQRDWSTATMTELADHIVQTHHDYMKTQLPAIDALFDIVIQVHGPRHPELQQARSVFRDMRHELDLHMQKEERILFPIIRRIESSPLVDFPCGPIDNPIAVMRHEHDSAGAALTALRQILADYAPPADACGSYRSLLEDLVDLERDLHRHIHKENNILFPKAQERQRQLLAAARRAD